MQTKNLIQMQANVLKVTSLKVGDVIKIIEKEYSDMYKTIYAVVIDMLNNGKETFITVLRYQCGYSKIDASVKTYSGSSDLNIFPATIDEVQKSLSSVVAAIKDKVEEDEKKLIDDKKALSEVIKFVEGEKSKQLTEASFSEISQKEHDRKIEQIDA